jgi:SAM-dependent methyltransferase
VAVALVAATTLTRAAHLLLATIAVQLIALFVVGMLCHGRLADSRPPPARLTEFFLCASLGGVAGGAFNALAAPLLFDRVLELPIALAAALLLRPVGRRTGESRIRWRHREGRRRWPIARRGLHRAPPGRWRRPTAIVLPLLAATAGVVLTVLVARARPQSTAAVIGCCLVVAIVSLPSRVAAAVAMTGLLAYATVADDRSPLLRRRTFFGVLVVRDDGTRTTLSHGTTLHGSQLDDPGLAAVPTTYYHRSGPLGQVFAAYRPSPLLDEVGVVGLGTGTVAAYAEEGRHLTYFEIDPAVVDIAEDPRLFTYLDAARRRADVDVVLGDARLSLADAPDGHFGLLVLDAFSSDAIPVHLLTREAVELYRRKVAPGGVVVVHISNRWLRLEGPLAAIADDLGLAALTANDGAVTPDQRREDKAASSWVALAGDEAVLAPLRAGGGWRPARREDGVAAWTDDFSNVVEVVRWRWWR